MLCTKQVNPEMRITRYKPLFSVNALYQLDGFSPSTEGMTISGLSVTELRMKDLKLLSRYIDNSVTVYYEGTETPAVDPLTSEPDLEITDKEYFYFGVDLSGKERLNGLIIHSTPAKAVEIGFPVLYDASIKIADGPAVLEIREDVKVMTPLFTFSVTVADSGIAADYASMEIKDESNALVDLKMKPVEVNDKAIDEGSAVPEFAFSVDASSLQAGIYQFKVGNVSKKYFIANGMNVQNRVALIRVMKNNFMEYKKELDDLDFAAFELMLQPVV